MAGGSVANTIRGLSSGFGISTGIIGACGDDEQGQLFVNNMSSNGVDLSRLRKKKGHTAQCVCLVDELGNRTMRPCLSNAVKVQVLSHLNHPFPVNSILDHLHKWSTMYRSLFRIISS